MDSLHAHLVFIPKSRRGVFTDQLLSRCEQVMCDVCADFGAELVEFNGERDHVHLLVRYPPQVRLSTLVGSLKGVSARRLRHEYPAQVRFRRIRRRRAAGTGQAVHRAAAATLGPILPNGQAGRVGAIPPEP